MIGRALILAVLVLTAASGAKAQQEPPEGCFCLADSSEPLPQIQRGCTRVKFGGQVFWRAVCRYADASGEVVVAPPIVITDDWTILNPGDPGCAVCMPTERNGPIVPRSDETPGTAEEVQ